MNVELSRYERIALDIAYSIYNREIEEGEKIKGRSTLSVKYSVSPETIRRAIKLLGDMGVVEVADKSGIYIKSREKAVEYIEKHQVRSNILNLKDNIEVLFEQKRIIEKKIMSDVNELIEHSIHLKSLDSIRSFQIKLKSENHLIDRSIKETQFWQKTGATIVGIHREGELLLSPGPDMKFKENDNILFIGNDKEIEQRVKTYVEQHKKAIE